MTELKREFTKIIRDGSKSLYNKGSKCEICGATEPLEFHHFKTLSVLANKWVAKNKLSINTLEEAQEHRVAFMEEYQEELYDLTVTLCKEHHAALHKVYGKAPNLGTSKKQARWVEKQREKYGLV